MEKAITLITSTALSFTEIAEKVGFTTSRYFSTAFKQYTGETPTQYKEKQKEIINRKRDNKPVVVIKATDNASFVNLVSALDEMQINGFNTFQINKLNKNDSILLNDFYAKHPDHLTKK